MKTCTKCGEIKSIAEFNLMYGKPRGYCKKCHVVASAAWAQNNPDKVRARMLRFLERQRASRLPPRYPPAKTNEERLARRRAARKRWLDNNPEAMNRARRAWDKANPGAVLAKTRRYQTRKRQAMPRWANQFFIDEIYDHRFRLEKALGVPMEVDHIVPLVSETVCGLHWEGNLRIIPRTSNRSKGNRFV